MKHSAKNDEYSKQKIEQERELNEHNASFPYRATRVIEIFGDGKVQYQVQQWCENPLHFQSPPMRYEWAPILSLDTIAIPDRDLAIAMANEVRKNHLRHEAFLAREREQGGPTVVCICCEPDPNGA